MLVCMEQITPQQKKAELDVYCIECSFSERVSTLAEAGRLMDSHSDGPHECCCYDHNSDRMVNGPAVVAFEESLPEVQ